MDGYQCFPFHEKRVRSWTGRESYARIMSTKSTQRGTVLFPTQNSSEKNPRAKNSTEKNPKAR